MLTNSDMQHRAWNVVEGLKTQYHFTFMNDCEDLLRTFINETLEEMSQEGRLSTEVELDFADAALTAFVLYMVTKVQNPEQPELDEDIFHRAKRAVTQLWPCSLD